MQSVYYIDGYNVLHHSSLLRPLAEQDFEAARGALIEKVGRFCSATGNQAKIVFDGRGRRAEPIPQLKLFPGLEVVYSPGHQSADALIERTVYGATNRRSIIVVSGDRGIRNLCRGLNALVMDPDNFLSSVRASDADTRAVIEKNQRPDNLRWMESRLGGASLDALRKLKTDLESK